MGALINYMGGLLILLAVFFGFAMMFSLGVQTGGWDNAEGLSTFNKTESYGSYFDNQSKSFKERIENVRANTGSELDLYELFRSIGQGISLSLVGLFAVVDIAISIIYDMAVIGIPLFFLGLAVVWIIFKFGSLIIRGITTGDA